MAPPKAKSRGFSDDEKAAMREAAQERTREESGEIVVLAKLAAMQGSDRVLGRRLHAIIKADFPELTPTTWYGMPAYANKDGKVVCFFQDAHKFKYRYATLGFSDKAKLDEGHIWPIYYALTELAAVEEAKIIELLKRAVG